MENSPAKRRKTSPTTSVPIDAPATPSRIPVVQQDGAKSLIGRPSFASPTRASLARHNPQLLNRPSSSGSGSERPGTRGRNLQDVFAKALGKRPPTMDRQDISGKDGEEMQSESTTQENEVPAEERYPNRETARATTPKAQITRSDGGGLSAKPRRMSRSPVKTPRKPLESTTPIEAMPEVDGIDNPFQKKGLRRSPIGTSQAQEVPSQLDIVPEANIHPFKKTGLRRSPVSSQLGATVQQSNTQTEGPMEFSTTPPGPAPSQAIHPFSWSIEQLQEKQQQEERLDQEDPVDGHQEANRQEANSQEEERRETALRDLESREEQRNKEQRQEEQVREQQRQEIQCQDEILQEEERQEEERREKELREEQRNIEKSPALILVKKPTISQTAMPQKSAIQSLDQWRDEPVQSPKQPRISQSGNPIFSTDSHSHDEPELPLTPTQRGLQDPVITTPPTGIHDTPSKRAKKSQARSAKLKSSPLKPRDPPPQEPTKEAQPAAAIEVELKNENPAKRRKSARFLVPEDPHAAKKKERDDLLRKLQQLQADVALGNQEAERLRLRQESKKYVPPSPKNVEDLIAMLTRSSAPELSSIPKPKPVSVFKSINSFLPFRSRRRAQPLILPVLDKPLPSHLPLELDDPLQHLQAFSPLTYTSTITLLPSEPTLLETSPQESESPIIQRHLIHASHPSGLFVSQIAMTVDTSTLSIASLEIHKLDASAETELGSFVRERASGEGQLGKDISVVCWAMGRWVEVAISRARFWCAVESEFGTAEARTKSFQTGAKTRKRKRQAIVIEDEDKASGNDENEEVTNTKWTRRQLLPHMRQTNMEISSEELDLRFEWKIGFDWTGEVDSSISANARLPRNWQQGDERNSLSKVPETFKRLVKEKGPLGAVRVTVGLLMNAS